MDGTQERRARKLVEALRVAGEHFGLLMVQGHLVVRDGVLCTDSPSMFEEADLKNAIMLGLLQANVVSGSVAWDWYVVK